MPSFTKLSLWVKTELNIKKKLLLKNYHRAEKYKDDM